MSVPQDAAAAPAWITVAQAAPYLRPAKLKLAQEKLATLPSDVKSRATTLLDSMAGLCKELRDLRQAGALLQSSLPTFVPKDNEYSGPHPHVAAVQVAAGTVFHGLVFCLGQKVRSSSKPEPAALELLAAMKDLPALDETTRATLHIEAREAMGSDLYLKVMAAHPELAP
jgi:hypothetical protein